MVIATDVDPKNTQPATDSPPSPPLSLSESGFAEGSCIAKESPCLSTLWFTVGGQELLISIKTGPLANRADKAVLGLLVGVNQSGLNWLMGVSPPTTTSPQSVFRIGSILDQGDARGSGNLVLDQSDPSQRSTRGVDLLAQVTPATHASSIEAAKTDHAL